jgi:hypothetical protein
VHPATSVQDQDELSSLLQVPIVAGTLNRGSDVVSAGMVVCDVTNVTSFFALSPLWSEGKKQTSARTLVLQTHEQRVMIEAAKHLHSPNRNSRRAWPNSTPLNPRHTVYAQLWDCGKVETDPFFSYPCVCKMPSRPIPNTQSRSRLGTTTCVTCTRHAHVQANDWSAFCGMDTTSTEYVNLFNAVHTVHPVQFYVFFGGGDVVIKRREEK